MTREEAIKVLQRMKYPYKCNKRKMIISNVDRDNEALDMAMQALSQEPCDDAISRDAAITIAGTHTLTVDETVKALEQLPSVTQKSGKWISVSERLPENLQTVNVTWQNHEPEPYYHDIKDRSFVATAVYYNEDWYWYSTTCADYLGEYGSNEIDKVDDAVEIIAWMPLPKPFEPQESENKE